MKIISWNVNGIRAVERKGDLEQFIQEHQPDVFLIQEIKANENQLGAIIEKYADYQQFYHSAEKPGYSGTAIWVRQGLNPTFHTGMPELNDIEGRISRVSIGNKEIIAVYFPNGGKSPEAWEGKLLFYEHFLSFVNQLREQGKDVIFAGDVNCAHEAIDLARPKNNEGKIGFHPAERAHLDKWKSDGWVDIWRERNPDVTDVYSWWHVITRSRAKNVGWRIDYFFVDTKQKDSISEVHYLTEQLGSDHCPVSLSL